jgi:two-component system, NarL family, response regulator DegU
MIRVLLADNHELIRLGLRTLFDTQEDIELMGEACSFQELISLSQQTQPDLILLDLHLQDGEVAHKIPDILKYCPLVLILTSCKDRDVHLLVFRLGAVGLVTKDQRIDIILKAIRAVCIGDIWIERSFTQEFWRTLGQANDTDSAAKSIATISNFDLSILTAREIEVARLAARGLPVKKIASQLFISHKTVRNQLAIVYGKCGVTNQVELVVQAAKLGLLT